MQRCRNDSMIQRVQSLHSFIMCLEIHSADVWLTILAHLTWIDISENTYTVFLAKCRDEKFQREEKVIGNGKGMPSSWPCLFLVMALEGIPVVYQFMKFDLNSDHDDVNEKRLNRKLEKYGLTLNDSESEYICNRLALWTDMVLID